MVAAVLIAGFVPEYRNLAFLFLFTIVSNSVVPMPYEPIMVVMGALYAPILAASVAASGNVIACFLDYKAIQFAFQHRLLHKVQNSDMYQGGSTLLFESALCLCARRRVCPFYSFLYFPRAQPHQ